MNDKIIYVCVGIYSLSITVFSYVFEDVTVAICAAAITTLLLSTCIGILALLI